jgi:O-antigen/teichoic acid export membrane protein
VITALVQIMSIPLLLEYLGPLEYSWVVVAFSLQSWWLLTDFGVSTSLQNAISKSRTMGKGDADLILSAASIVIPITLILAIILGFFNQQMASLLLPPTANRDGSGGELILVTGLFSLLLVVGNIGNRVFYARHKGYWANIIPAVGSLVTLVGLFALKSEQNNKSIILAMSVWIGPTAILSSGSFCFICLKAFYRSSGGPTLNICKNLIKKGGEFTLFAFFGALTLQIDYLIIGKLLSDREILIYVISSKCIGLIIFFYGSVVQAFWPICSEASATNKWSVVDKILKKIIVIGIVMTIIGSLSIWVFQAEIINLIAPNQDLLLPTLLWILFIVYALIRVWSDGFAMLLQSMNKMRIFLMYIPFQALISVCAQIELTEKFGLNGLLLGSIISFAFTSAWILPFAYKKMKK